MFEALKAMDPARLNFNSGGLLILNITIAIIMFGVALEIKPASFKELFRKPRPVIAGVISQIIFLPIITFLLILAFGGNLTVGVAMGMILVASCPGGNVSNFLSTFSKGNATLSVSLTAISTTLAIFITPLNFAFWGKMYQWLGPFSDNPLLKQLEIDPIEMFKTVIILLGIPIVLGMLFNHYFVKATEKIKKPISIFSIVVFMSMVVIMFVNNYQYFLKYIPWILLIVLLHNGLALLTGYSAGTMFRLDERNRRTIAIETGIQNSGLGLVLIFNPNIFPSELPLGGMMIVTAWWGIWHILSGLTIASYWRYRTNRKLKLG